MTRRPWLWGGALVALVVGALVLCRAPGGRGADLDRSRVLVVVPEIGASWARNFNPLLVPGQQLWPSIGGIYEPLLIFNSLTGRYVPWLATAHRWGPDHRTLTFELRRQVVWSDGAPFDAEDVAYTFELLRREPALDNRGVWQHLERLEVVDSHRVRFHFSRPHVPSLYPISSQPIVPEHVFRHVPDPLRFTNPSPVGTGPFVEVRRFQPQVYELGRNPRHWRPGKPAVEAIRVPAFPSNDQGSLAIIRGEVDWAGVFMPAIDRIFVSKNPKHHHYWFPTISGTVMLYANTRRPPFDDERVRKAVSHAIDRHQMVRVAVHGYSHPADGTGLSDLYRRWRSPEAARVGSWTELDRDRARALLDAAGVVADEDGRRLHRGAPLEVTIDVVSGWSDWVLAAQIAAHGLAAVGIEASVRSYDRGAWLEKVRTGDFDLCVGWSNTSPTPYRFYREIMSTDTVVPVGEPAASNWHRYGSPEVDRLLRSFERTSDDARRRRLLDELQLHFARHAPAIPLYPQAAWGEFNDSRFVGFPTAENPYARLPPFPPPEYALVLGELRPR